ncbi:MAG TPA: glycosyltransferase [Opitutaceae bacterium]|nr:glycosyltransferase [Opitutaceae bacterium]
MRSPRRICLVTPSHVSADPRLVKEANALCEAGYSVHVVAGWYYPPLDKHDLEIYAAAAWERAIVYYLTGPRVLLAKLRRDLAYRRLANKHAPSYGLAVSSLHAAVRLLTRAASKIEADLFIGHGLPALPAVATAARERRANYGFDAEAFHSQETEQRAAGGPEAASVHTIEEKLLPGAIHLTGASPLICQAYLDTYRLDNMRSVLNTPSLEDAPLEPRPGTTDGPPKLYWFSHTVGHGRGLEHIIQVLARMRTVCELHLRGISNADFVNHLRLRANQLGFRGKIVTQPPAAAREMVRLAAPYDLGLSLEQPWPPNRDLCLANKIFTYLLAGVPVVLTSTRAQQRLAEELGEAALPVDLQSVDDTAAKLDAFLQSPERRARARERAWKLAQSRFNWDVEKTKFLDSVAAALESPPARAASR